ncbi:MAG: hypothetical protein U0572_17650 [Phycisphaerales bacterium]
MTSFGANVSFLAKAEGFAQCTALDALAKGALESELPIAAIAGSRRPPFEAIGRLVPDEALQRLLQRHGLEIAVTSDALRALAVAHRQLRNNRSGVALVSNDQLPLILPTLQTMLPLPRMPEAGLVLVVEDNPDVARGICPHRQLASLGVPALAPATLDELRDALEQATRISRAGASPVAIVAHASLLRSTDTLEARPNRIVDSIDAATAARFMRRGARPGEAPDALRMARRLELNRLVSLPSPGEREPLGLVCVGPAFVAAAYLLNETRLSGRVPMLKLGLTRPIDDSAIVRLVARCEQVILLEPRPGAIAGDVLDAVEAARRQGERVAHVWTRAVPPPVEDAGASSERWALEDGDAVRPSTLARKLLHLLHQIRPTLDVASRLAPVPPELERLVCPPRGQRLGLAGAIEYLREILLEVDHEVRSPRVAEAANDTRSTALALEGEQPSGEWDRVVLAEVWDRRRFSVEGVGAVRQAARDPRPRIVVVPDVGGDDDVDIERIASAAVPADAAARVAIRTADLSKRDAIKALLIGAAASDGVTIVVARDGPPPRRDAAAVERLLGETDRLGFMPRQRLTWPVDVSCELRPPSTEWLIERGLERGSEPLEGAWHVERTATADSEFRFVARPLLEQVEIVRTRPPAPGGRGVSTERIAPPRPLHAGRGLWRGHIAGFRGDGPGLAAAAIADAGANMGYRVQTVHSNTPIGAGRRAWAEVLFSRSRDESVRADASTAELLGLLPPEVPYGEADLLLGVDGVETLRAIGPEPALRVAALERTSAVVNAGPLDDQFDEPSLEACRKLREGIASVTSAEHSSVEDFAVACRGRFLTDRVLDLVLLGLAFQRGLVPVHVEAMETAVKRLEARGYGRCVDAFEFGRRLAVEPRLLEWARSADEEWRDASGMRLLRRLLLETRKSGWGGRRRAHKFASLARESIAKLPGLDDTEEGHAARRDFIVALHRCLSWGGMPLARRYADLVKSLHAADRPEGGHELTQHAIRPLAEALLVRDLFHMAAMSTSLEHRRRTRDRLAVRLARGDVMERRYLNRVEVTAFGRRYRLDVRSSDWPARVLSVVAPLMPERFRGARGEQEVRAYVTSLVERAIRGATDNPKVWLSTMRRLAQVCESTGGFRGVSAGELRARVEGE